MMGLYSYNLSLNVRCQSLFGLKLVPNFKPAKFETFKTEADFRLRNSLRCQKIKFAVQALFSHLGLTKLPSPKLRQDEN